MTRHTAVRAFLKVVDNYDGPEDRRLGRWLDRFREARDPYLRAIAQSWDSCRAVCDWFPFNNAVEQAARFAEGR